MNIPEDPSSQFHQAQESTGPAELVINRRIQLGDSASNETELVANVSINLTRIPKDKNSENLDQAPTRPETPKYDEKLLSKVRALESIIKCLLTNFSNLKSQLSHSLPTFFDGTYLWKIPHVERQRKENVFIDSAPFYTLYWLRVQMI